MATPFSTIYEAFNSKLTPSEQTKFDSNNKRKELLKFAYPKWKPYFRKLTIDYNAESISENLDETEVLAFALLMFIEFCFQEWSKWNSITNTITDSTKVTGVDGARNSKYTRYSDAKIELNDLLATLI